MDVIIKMPTIIRPQPGPQERFLATPADICIYGGAAGGGKTFALLMEPIRHAKNPGFGAVILRKNITQITTEGGLWDESFEVYGKMRGARALQSPRLKWIFPSGARVSFMHLERDEELFKWQGSQIALLEFDELTHFTERMFFYMLSRCRSSCGVAPYVRATCNPDADSWVAKFIEWWIDQETGYPISERSGVLRYMLRQNDEIRWGDTPEELWKRFDLKTTDQKQRIKSVTFIASRLEDNQILMRRDPSYMANLQAQSIVERERLLYGNWKIKPAAGLFFKRSQAAMIENIPNDIVRWVRAWDLAATTQDENGNAAYSAGILMGKRECGRYVIANVINIREKAADIRKLIRNVALIDRKNFKSVCIRLPQDPGQAGKDQAESYIKYLSGFHVKAIKETGSKVSRAEPMAAQWQAGNFDVLIAEWNNSYFSQLESFPESQFKDMVDAGSSAFAELEGNTFDLSGLLKWEVRP